MTGEGTHETPKAGAMAVRQSVMATGAGAVTRGTIGVQSQPYGGFDRRRGVRPDHRRGVRSDHRCGIGRGVPR